MARYLVNVQGSEYDIELEYTSENYVAKVNGHSVEIKRHRLGDTRYLLLIEGASYEVDIRDNGSDGSQIVFMVGDEIEVAVENYQLAQLRKAAGMTSTVSIEKIVKATMPGLIVDIKVAPGDRVAKGDPLMLIEAMKMENVIKAHGDAIVKQVFAKAGSSIDKGAKLLEFE